MKNFWFKRRRYGYGWVPVTWQGFVAIIIYVGLIIGVAALMDGEMSGGEVTSYLVFVIIATLLLMVVGFCYGPKPKWRWGSKPSDNPEEDF